MTKTRLLDRSTIEQLISFKLANQVVDQTFQAFLLENMSKVPRRL